MLDFDDIQHILLMRVPALTGRYEFLSFRNAKGGRTWLSAIQEKVQSAAQVRASVEQEKRWVTVAFTWNGETPFHQFVHTFYKMLPVRSKRNPTGVDKALRDALASRLSGKVKGKLANRD